MKIINGVKFPEEWPDFNCQLFLFLYGHKLLAEPFWRPGDLPTEPGKGERAYSGEGRFEHACILIKMLFPKSFEFNDWSIAALKSFCGLEHTAITGCAGSGKSTTAAVYALLWLLAGPDGSAVLIASTSIDAAKKRIWKNIRQYYTELLAKCNGKVGNTVLIGNPKPCIRSSPTDTANGIYVVAVAKGEVDKGVESLKGFHPSRLLMIGDEADAVSQAVIDVEVNQQVGTLEYKQIWLGNDPSLFNPLGKLMSPAKGVAIGLQHKDWISVKGIHCLRFDAYDSPNLRDGDKWKGIVRKKDIEMAEKNMGGNNTPQFWIMMRGLHPPDGVENTVLSESLLIKHNCSDSVVWDRGFTNGGVLDPAFGGDRCVFRHVKWGNDSGGNMRLLLCDVNIIHITVGDLDNPPEYQIAKRCQEICKVLQIKPENFAMDGTGTGRGVVSIMTREWSPRINIVQFGGSCSDMPVSDDNEKPAKEVYDRKITELWYSFRQFVEAGMIRGLDPDTAQEFCRRTFEVDKQKVKLEKKEEMRTRGLPSPDLADAVVLAVHMMREKGVNAVVQTQVKQESGTRMKELILDNDLDGDGYGSRLDDVESVEYSYF